MLGPDDTLSTMDGEALDIMPANPTAVSEDAATATGGVDAETEGEDTGDDAGDDAGDASDETNETVIDD